MCVCMCGGKNKDVCTEKRCDPCDTVTCTCLLTHIHSNTHTHHMHTRTRMRMRMHAHTLANVENIFALRLQPELPRINTNTQRTHWICCYTTRGDRSLNWRGRCDFPFLFPVRQSATEFAISIGCDHCWSKFEVSRKRSPAQRSESLGIIARTRAHKEKFW